MMENHPINELLGTTIQKVKELVDANTVIGEPIHAGEITLVPISRVSVGFASGGTDFTTKNRKSDTPFNFGGGGGAGVHVDPVAFLVVNGSSVKILPVAAAPATTVDRVVDMVPEVVDKVTGFIEKQQEKKAEPAEESVDAPAAE